MAGKVVITNYRRVVSPWKLVKNRDHTTFSSYVLRFVAGFAPTC
jgi:hypothetical protein